jgi:uncharacterized protein (DUF1015 family)
MAVVRPFRGVRPADDLARHIIALPYDVMNRQEARQMLDAEPDSFLRVTRSDALLPDSVDQHGAQAYARAHAELEGMLEDGRLVQDASPCFYLYRQTWRGQTQTGLMSLASVSEYDTGTVKRHELTRPKKEQDRVDHVSTLQAQTGLVFLAWRDEEAPSCRALLAELADRLSPAWTVATSDGVTHALTPVTDPADVESVVAAFAQLSALYIADGHHRSAAASRVCATRGGTGGSDGFLAGVFPDSELQVLAYNRVVQDLHGRSPADFLAAVSEHFELEHGVDAIPSGRGAFTMRLVGQDGWIGLKPKRGVVPDGDPVGRLDVAVLQDRILGPLLGIENPRTNTRIRFVGGIRGAGALASAVDSGEAAVAFHLHPTGLDQLFDVADADRLMPPKSTWFEPKLRGGVVVHRFEQN